LPGWGVRAAGFEPTTSGSGGHGIASYECRFAKAIKDSAHWTHTLSDETT
jgi:hypothetical protein